MADRRLDRSVRVSKFLSRILRHQPEQIGLRLDGAGWAGVSELLAACNNHGFALDEDELRAVVRTNSKQRFAFSPDGVRIRASQGHSVAVNLGYAPEVPPNLLYHGTAAHSVPAIRGEGLKRGKRHQVHLSGDAQTARQVGGRHGNPVVLEVRAGQMQHDGHVFHRSSNGVWLTDHVPAEYLQFPE